jgi:hypothetical protein
MRRACPKEAASSSPRLRGTSYPGSSSNKYSNRNAVAAIPFPPAGAIPATTPLALFSLSERVPKVARSSQPWALGRNPVGILGTRGSCGEDLVEGGVEEVGGGGARGGEPGFQRGAPAQQLVHLRHDPLLFGDYHCLTGLRCDESVNREASHQARARRSAAPPVRRTTPATPPPSPQSAAVLLAAELESGIATILNH